MTVENNSNDVEEINVTVELEDLEQEIKSLIETIEETQKVDEDDTTLDDLLDFFETEKEEREEKEKEEQELLEKELEDLTEEEKKALEERENLLENEQEFRENLLITTNDNTEQLIILNENLTELKEKVEEISYGSNTILTYGIFYIPLGIIIFLIWRFLATFLRSFR